MSKKITNQELNNVSGGKHPNELDVDITCKRCTKVFKANEVETQEWWDNCGTFTLYKCPNCASWCYINGKVHH